MFLRFSTASLQHCSFTVIHFANFSRWKLWSENILPQFFHLFKSMEIQFNHNQCAKIRRFLKLFRLNFLTKAVRIFGNYFGYFGKHRFRARTATATFWATLGKIWASFIQTSGHTEFTTAIGATTLVCPRQVRKTLTWMETSLNGQHQSP